MSKTIRLKNPNPLPNQNDADVAKYGRAYWSLSSDVDLPVKFNLMGDAVPQDGQQITYEEWVNKQSAKGTEYLQLKKVRIQGAEDSPEQVSMSTSSHTPKPAWQPRDDDRIVAQWAIGQAVQYVGSEKDDALVEEAAKMFYAMVERVKGGKPYAELDLKTVGVNQAKVDTSIQGGLKQAWNKTTEAKSLDEVAPYDGEEIDLSDIPF